MTYSKPVDQARAVREHDEALANHQRAWDDMHEIGVTVGRETEEYASARRAVVLLRNDVTTARQRVESSRTWSR